MMSFKNMSHTNFLPEDILQLIVNFLDYKSVDNWIDSSAKFSQCKNLLERIVKKETKYKQLVKNIYGKLYKTLNNYISTRQYGNKWEKVFDLILGHVRGVEKTYKSKNIKFCHLIDPNSDTPEIFWKASLYYEFPSVYVKINKLHKISNNSFYSIYLLFMSSYNHKHKFLKSAIENHIVTFVDRVKVSNSPESKILIDIFKNDSKVLMKLIKLGLFEKVSVEFW